MTRPNQKVVERAYMDAFLEVMAFPNIQIEQPSPPRPDFILRMGSKGVGVEMTEYHLTSKIPNRHPRHLVEQEWRKLQKTVMRAVKECPAIEGMHGMFFFKELNLPSRKETDAFVTQTVAFARGFADHAPPETLPHELNEYPLLKKYLRELRFSRSGCSHSWDWNNNTAWLDIDEKALVKSVRQKTQNNYNLEGLDQFWLLIVSGQSLSQGMGVELQHDLQRITEVNTALLKSSFCKAFVFQYMYDVVYEWPEWQKVCRDNKKR